MMLKNTANPLFIVGSYRSGTSLLRLILNSHSKIFIPEETRYIPYLGSNIKGYGSLESEESRKRLVNEIRKYLKRQKWDDIPSFYEINKEVQSYTYSEIIKSVSLSKCPINKKSKLLYWGDKTPSYLMVFKYINELFPDAKFINVVRDGRDVCASVMGLPISGARNVTSAALEWNERILQGLLMEKCLGSGRVLTIKYEDLVTKTDEVLHLVCSFLDIIYEGSMQEFSETPEAKILARQPHHANVVNNVNSSRISIYKKSMSISEIRLYESYTYNSLDALGYQAKFSFIPQPNNITKYFQLSCNFLMLIFKRLKQKLWRRC
jgi:hypothetical protein